MEIQLTAINQKRVLKNLIYTAVFNTFIAMFLTAIKFGGGPVDNFIVSQCIGISKKWVRNEEIGVRSSFLTTITRV